MRTIVFFKGGTLVGVAVCNDLVSLTKEQIEKLHNEGISFRVWRAAEIRQDDDLDKHIDTLIQAGMLGRIAIPPI